MSGQASEQLTLFQEVSLASLFPWLESKKEKKTTVTYGRKCSELSENLRRVGLSVRMYLESCALPLPTLSRTWSVKTITSSCLILKLRLSERRTDGNGCSLLPTVTATVATHGGPSQRDSGGKPGLQMAAMMWPTPTSMDACGLDKNLRADATPTRSILLSQKVAMFPTPKVQNARGSGQSRSLRTDVKMFPTPRASCCKPASTPTERALQDLQTAVLYSTPQARDFRTGQSSRWEDPNRSRNLNDQIGGQLNPTWVEWLMGFPTGWTDLNA